jgi:hypothetical protein
VVLQVVRCQFYRSLSEVDFYAVRPYVVLRFISSSVRLFLLVFFVFGLVRGVNVTCFCCPLSFDVACCVFPFVWRLSIW